MLCVASAAEIGSNTCKQSPSYTANDWWSFGFIFGVIVLLNMFFPTLRALFFDNLTPLEDEELNQQINRLMDETGFQWGIGISYTFVDDAKDGRYTRQDSWSIFADVVSVVNDADIDPTRLYSYDKEYYDKLSVLAYTVGILYHF